MVTTSTCEANVAEATWRDYLELCKPRVVLLMILTSLVGMVLAVPGSGHVPWSVLLMGNLGIALAAGSAAAVNHLADYHIDKVMARTQRRPVVQGKLSTTTTCVFALLLGALSMVVLLLFTNPLTAGLTLLSMVGYAGVYTLYLKHATSQNIVLGGLAGATPPLLGWVAVTGQVSVLPIILVAVIFIWTPPHFWALAIDRIDDYAKANVPMLPNTHGIEHTKKWMVFYTALLALVTYVPVVMQATAMIYCGVNTLLNVWFFRQVWRFHRDPLHRGGMRVFRDSIVYLALYFMVLLLDHFFVVSG